MDSCWLTGLPPWAFLIEQGHDDAAQVAAGGFLYLRGRFGSTPLGWTRYFGQEQLIELLEPLTAPDEPGP